MIYSLHNYRVTCDAKTAPKCYDYIDIASIEGNAHAAFQGVQAADPAFGWRSYGLGWRSYGIGYCCPACSIPGMP